MRAMIALMLTTLAGVGVLAQRPAPTPAPRPIAAAVDAQASDGVPVYAAEIVNRFPHDPTAYTEGLLFCGGALYESTGEVGTSDIRRVSLATGKVERRTPIASDLFGEGIACVGKSLLSVTWQTGIGFRWSLPAIRQTATFRYPGEGWGMTTDGTQVILSDGTATLRRIDPATFAERGRIAVTLNGRPLRNLNEVEYVRGAIVANVWMSGFIVRIDPTTGKVDAIIDLRPLVAEIGATDRDSVANGIAYDAASDRLFVTGKNWRTLYEIKLGAEVGRSR